MALTLNRDDALKLSRELAKYGPADHRGEMGETRF